MTLMSRGKINEQINTGNGRITMADQVKINDGH